MRRENRVSRHVFVLVPKRVKKRIANFRTLIKRRPIMWKTMLIVRTRVAAGNLHLGLASIVARRNAILHRRQRYHSTPWRKARERETGCWWRGEGLSVCGGEI